MNIGIIGYGSMGKMLLEKFAASGIVNEKQLMIANRSIEKIKDLSDKYNVCESNAELAKRSDIIFVCVKPTDMKNVFEDIAPFVKVSTLTVSLNGNISFELIEKILDKRKIAKVIPSVTAEIDRSQTLVCCNSLVENTDKKLLKDLLGCMGFVIELPENEIGMGSELVSCMPGFISSIFDVICQTAKMHTSIPETQIVRMVLNTLAATGELMTDKKMTFGEVVDRVATKGGITQEGTSVIYDKFPVIADELFVKTLAKRAQIAKNAEEQIMGI